MIDISKHIALGAIPIFKQYAKVKYTKRVI